MDDWWLAPAPLTPRRLSPRGHRRLNRLALLGLLQISHQSHDELLHATPCPNLCHGHGWCDTHDRRCECYSGYTGADCSLRTCPQAAAWADHPNDLLQTDIAHNPAECSRRGICDTSVGECICDHGFDGAACERKRCANDCSGNGRCVSMHYYASIKDPGQGTVYTYDTVWDAHKLYGCLCDDGFTGYDCSLRKCPTGDDPGTPGVTEIQSLTCTADGGNVVLGFGGHWTTLMTYRANAATLKAALEDLKTINTPAGSDGIRVTFSAPATTMCDADGDTTTYIEFLQNFGTLPLLQVTTSSLTHSSGSVAFHIARYREGTKEDVDCSHRGLCDPITGTCDCSITSSCPETCFTTSDGYGNTGARGDCGAQVVTIDSCPGEVECNSHGFCDDTTLSCTCQSGYTGADCSLKTCPYSKSWFSLPNNHDVAHQDLVECGNGGICNQAFGECECGASFEGAACEYMVCPGRPECSGHGECLSMALLAEAAEVNGVATSITYGATPNDALRWDWDRVRGCKCDEGYTYYDCSGHMCPFGDDPLSVNQLNEIQLINCDLSSSNTGAITFTFRGETVTVPAETTTLSDLEIALESMDSIDDVRLYFDIGQDDDTRFICSSAGTDLYVEFLRPTGDVPLISTDRRRVHRQREEKSHCPWGTVYLCVPVYYAVCPDGRRLTQVVSISEYTKGTKEWEECSGRGLCNREDGTCSCFLGYGSSNGQGSPGPYADCGSPLPALPELFESPREHSPNVWSTEPIQEKMQKRAPGYLSS